jgi:predicted negative regulator of RcsB-dependent stress response
MPTEPPSIDAAVEAQVFWLRFQKEIAAALIILILAIVGFAGYRFYTHQRNSTAAELLGKAKNPQDYQEVIVRYPGTPAGASAYLLLAEAQRNDKKLAEANASLQTFIEKFPQHDFVPTAQLAMAANLESMGKNDEALSIYQQVANKYPNTYQAPLALISEVPLLKAKNRIEDARRVCEEILTKYRMPGGQQAESARDDRLETVWAGEAMRQLRSLKPTEQPKPAPGAGATLPSKPPGPGVPPMIAAPTLPPSTAPISAGAPTPKKPK